MRSKVITQKVVEIRGLDPHFASTIFLFLKQDRTDAHSKSWTSWTLKNSKARIYNIII
jgi:hypothetical protein